MKFSLTLALILCLVTPSAFAKIQVFACEPEWQALANTIGGDHVVTYSATTAFQDPHYVEARPSLIAKARRADVLFCTGAELEIGWLPLLLRQSGNAKIQKDKPGYFLATLHVELIEVPTELDRSQGDVHAAGNPHVHWDPYRLLRIAKAFSERLAMIDAINADDYRQQYRDFALTWETSIKRWQAETRSLQGKKAVVYHKNWSYLLNWLNIEAVGDLEPKPGLPPTSAHLAHLLSTVRISPPDFILITHYQNDKGAQWLSKKTDVPVVRLPYTVGGSEWATDLETLYNEALSVLKSTQ